MDYRILTRKLVKFFANYNLKFHGGKEFRLFETGVAFVSTLIPIGFYLIVRKLDLSKILTFLTAAYLILITLFYCLFCYLESVYLNVIITQPKMVDGIISFHYNNVNYKFILFLTIVSTFICGLITKRILNRKKASL